MKGTDLEQPQLQSGLLATLSRFVGAGPDATKKTFEAAIPTAMYALADHGSDEVGARGLLDGLQSGTAPQLDIKDLGSTLADPQVSDRLLTSSGGFLEKFLGGKMGGILDGLTSHGGLGRSASAKVAALAAPLALGVIGKRARDERLDANGLSEFLREQKAKVALLVPAALRRFVGLREAENVVRAAEPVQRRAEEIRTTPRIVEAKRTPEIGWRAKWPWLLAALAAFIGLGWLVGHAVHRPRLPDVTSSAPRVPDVTVPAAPAPETVAPAPAPEVAKPAPDETEPVAGLAPALKSDSGAIKQIGTFLESGAAGERRFAIDGLTFENGSSALTAEGRRVGGDLAALMSAHPDARLRIEGFADASGDSDANTALSQARAESIKRLITGRGIGADRVETAGLGDRRPIAPNDSASGRAANRRIEVVVTAK